METAIQTVTDMISQRGYTIISQDDETIICVRSKGEKLVIFITPIIKFNINKVKECISIAHNMEVNHCIAIYVESITSSAKKIVESSVDIDIELFTLKELQYNITKHRFVPKHIKLSEKDAKVFKKDYGIKFPIILKGDPVSRFYNYKRGDIIKIEGNDGYISHRIAS